MISEQQFLADFHALPPDKQATVLDFIDFLHYKLARAQTTKPESASEPLLQQREAEGDDE